eukprot:sb/3476593/
MDRKKRERTSQHNYTIQLHLEVPRGPKKTKGTLAFFSPRILISITLIFCTFVWVLIRGIRSFSPLEESYQFSFERNQFELNWITLSLCFNKASKPLYRAAQKKLRVRWPSFHPEF